MRLSGAYITRMIKKDLSSPELISLFLLVCLVVIFSLESVGLIGAKNFESAIIPLAKPAIIKNNSNSSHTQEQIGVSFPNTDIKKTFYREIEDRKVSSLILEAAEFQTKYERTLKKQGKASPKQNKEPIVDYADDGEIFFFYV